MVALYFGMTAFLEPHKRAALELMRFTGARCDELWAHGFFTSDDRVELLDGQIVTKLEASPRHVYGLTDLRTRLLLQFHTRATVLNQGTIFLLQDGRPDPDIALIRLETPRDRLPLPEDIHLLIEVSDSTLARDRETKLALYARDNILEYWIVNLEQNQLEVYREPDGTRYASSFTVKNGAATACLGFPNDLIDWR